MPEKYTPNSQKEYKKVQTKLQKKEEMSNRRHKKNIHNQRTNCRKKNKDWYNQDCRLDKQKKDAASKQMLEEYTPKSQKEYKNIIQTN